MYSCTDQEFAGPTGSQIRLWPVPSNDPNDPLNWNTSRKYFNFGITAFYTLLVFALLDISPTLWQAQVEELGISWSQENNTFAINCVGLAIGSVFLIPLASKYGRRPIYIGSSIVNCAMSIWLAKANTYTDLMLANLISGFTGSVSEVLVQMTVEDLFFVHQRGMANSIYLLASNTGVFLAPIAAGFIASSQGWRWGYYWCAIFIAINIILFIFCYEETKFTMPTTLGDEHPLPPIEESTIDKHGKTGLPEVYASAVSTPDIDQAIPMRSYRQRMALVTPTHAPAKLFLRHVWQPFIILAAFPAITYVAFTWGTQLAWYSMVNTTSASVFPYPPYNFSTTGVGLLNLPAFIGASIASVYAALLSDRSILWLAKRNNGIYEPEFRLYTAIFPAIASAVGVFVYGLSTAHGMHWIIPCIGIGIFGYGFVGLGHGVLTYLLDGYGNIAGDALVGVAFVRNICATAIVFAATPWMEALGMYDLFVCVGCLAVFFALLGLPVIIWGRSMRVHGAKRYMKMARLQYDPRGL
ncbi:hypothetical protein D6C84_06595 [Aureobasidium pullulans]|uniref:Major facilitator superfamily (MFS) profile domain-containing protein n=1 Tax=Aureobasidium pullulans TaxID=5580 RepID=A0A4S8VNM6_AURPU|nr:hypothetical protein D6D23_09741 [Aureobasidium pullulans]THW68665.1 hypothetical protein D6D19_08836 [Aureobasidium pullulans]THZ81454.1 hypothetical protein D6C84_06595 [Aureobasidium pullulans]